jgi:hypothetical protein
VTPRFPPWLAVGRPPRRSRCGRSGTSAPRP